MRYVLKDDVTQQWVGQPVDVEPAPAVGQSVVLVPDGYPADVAWSIRQGPDGDLIGGFADLGTALMSVGRFKLLFTQDERIAMRAAARQNAAVEDFMDLLAGFTDGVSLSDPVMTVALDHLQAAGLLTADRAAAIAAGQAPS